MEPIFLVLEFVGPTGMAPILFGPTSYGSVVPLWIVLYPWISNLFRTRTNVFILTMFAVFTLFVPGPERTGLLLSLVELISLPSLADAFWILFTPGLYSPRYSLIHSGEG